MGSHVSLTMRAPGYLHTTDPATILWVPAYPVTNQVAQWGLRGHNPFFHFLLFIYFTFHFTFSVTFFTNCFHLFHILFTNLLYYVHTIIPPSVVVAIGFCVSGLNMITMANISSF